jgi:SRSO17 transposase
LHWSNKNWKRSSQHFRPFVSSLTEELGRTERRLAATRYVEGLLLEGQRKSIEPMATRLGVDAQSLQQFVADSPWEAQVLWSAIRRKVIPSFEPLESWIVDETGWLKQGQHSVGVAHQYCGAVGKQAHCQVSVELVVSDGWVGAPVAGRLYLPASWTRDGERCCAAGVPAQIEFRTKPQIALELIDEARAEAVAAAPVLAGSVYGDSSEFRQGLRQRGVEFFLQITPTAHKAWPQEVRTVKKLKRRYVAEDEPPAQTLLEIARALPKARWRNCSWKARDASLRRTRLAWQEVYLAHELRNTPGKLEQLWLVIDWPVGESEPYHCYLAWLKAEPALARCLRLSRGRWQIEQYFQRSKDDLGLDHYEGRSWRGFHHHLVLSAAAYLFVAAMLVRSKKNFWPDVGSGAGSDASVAGEVVRLLSVLPARV